MLDDSCAFVATMVSTMAWNDTCNMLAAVADNKVVIWYYPNVAFVDPDIVQRTLLQLDQKYEHLMQKCLFSFIKFFTFAY